MKARNNDDQNQVNLMAVGHVVGSSSVADKEKIPAINYFVISSWGDTDQISEALKLLKKNHPNLMVNYDLLGTLL